MAMLVLGRVVHHGKPKALSNLLVPGIMFHTFKIWLLRTNPRTKRCDPLLGPFSREHGNIPGCSMLSHHDLHSPVMLENSHPSPIKSLTGWTAGISDGYWDVHGT